MIDFKDLTENAIDGVLAENEDAIAAYDAITNRGLTSSFARDEIGRAFLGCYWEVSKGMPDRMAAVWAGLKVGLSTIELFPDQLYEG